MLPHDDEHDYLNDAYLDDDDDNNDSQNRNYHRDDKPDSDMRHRDHDMRKMGQSSSSSSAFRNSGDMVDLRNQQHEIDFRGSNNSRDYDMRRGGNMQMDDDDYRMGPYGRDQVCILAKKHNSVFLFYKKTLSVCFSIKQISLRCLNTVFVFVLDKWRH